MHDRLHGAEPRILVRTLRIGLRQQRDDAKGRETQAAHSPRILFPWRDDSMPREGRHREPRGIERVDAALRTPHYAGKND